MHEVLIRNPQGFPEGLTSIIKMDDQAGMNFSCLRLRQGEHYEIKPSLESVHLLMVGKIIFSFPHQSKIVERTGYFEENPIALHCDAHTKAHLEALTDCEVLIIETQNNETFEPILFEKNNLLEVHHRGKNLLEDTSYRIVRTIFDKRNRQKSNLVLGEIITFQGGWSSFPSHHHPQSEIYHYRFSEPQGFAFGENGEEALKIRHYDTYKIASGKTHAHATSPGYALYTLWFIRHLPENPYHVPTFSSEHEWLREESANKRAWKIFAE